jgi:hypothetical protein
MQKSLQGDLWLDSELEDGHLRVQGEVIFMSQATYRALSFDNGALNRAPADTFWLPRAVVDADAAEDLRRGLALVDPEPSEYCVYGPCILRATQVHPDGFSLCDEHAALMGDWDDLLV